MKTKQTQKNGIMDSDWGSREWGIQGLISARWENEREEETRELKGEGKVRDELKDWRSLTQRSTSTVRKKKGQEVI